jgi:hypothetical protein
MNKSIQATSYSNYNNKQANNVLMLMFVSKTINKAGGGRGEEKI